MSKYYLVTAKCGHVGRNKYIPIDFPIKAATGVEAAAIARQKARVKRHHKNAILKVREVNFETFLKQIKINNNDPYLFVRSKHEQERFFSQIACRLQNDNLHVYKNYYNKRKSVDIRIKKNIVLSEAKKAELDEFFRIA